MSEGTILITAPALDTKNNVSGVSSVANFIISNNTQYQYRHFELGRKDDEKRNIAWVLRLLKTYCKWAGIAVAGKIKLVHFNFALSKPSVIRDAPLVLFAKLVRRKVIIHLHGGEYLFSKQPHGWMKWLLKRVFSGKTPVIVLSEAEAPVVKEKYGAKNIVVLPNCVDLKEAEAFTRNYNSAEILKLLFIGRISKTKGLDFIYEALDKLRKKNIPFVFTMAGAGPEEKEYVQQFANLLGGQFEFKGVVSGDTKTALFKNSDVFLLPSHFEGLPMSLLESMSFGLVPVVTAVGSIPTVVKHENTGMITALDTNTAAIVADYVEKLVHDPQLVQAISKNAKECIFKNYNPAVYISTLNKIYKEEQDK